MNILFVLRSLNVGGLEVVTAVLANKFVAEGHQVFVFAFEERTGRAKERFCKEVRITIGKGYKKSDDNMKIVRGILISEGIDIVINQWGLPLAPIRVINAARKSLDVKVISVYHNDPMQNGRVQDVETAIAKAATPLTKSLLHLKKGIYRTATALAMRYIYRKSDCFMVLSPSFISRFRQFTGLKKTPKLLVQTNPVTIDNSGFDYKKTYERKEIIYVGRIDYTQKRVYRVIETWSQLEYHYPDWCLTIIGDGPERGNLEQMADDLELQRVKFEGFQPPKAYYERASLLVLASEFEGFPLVLAEAMSFGVVPIVYASFSSVYDIIEDGRDGVIIEKNADGFNAALMAEKTRTLLDDDVKMDKMSHAAIEKSKNYSVDKIYRQWLCAMNNLKQMA